MTEDIGMPVPDPTAINFADVEHPLLESISHQMKATEDGNFIPRIKCIDDNHFYKLKIGERLRGASWFINMDLKLGWLVSTGTRESGSRLDFYEKLKSDAESNLKKKRNINPGYKPHNRTDSDYLLPQEEDKLCLSINQEFSNVFEIAKAIEKIKKEILEKGGSRNFSFSGDINLQGTISYSTKYNEIDLTFKFDPANDKVFTRILTMFRPGVDISEWEVTPLYENGQRKYICYTLWD